MKHRLILLSCWISFSVFAAVDLVEVEKELTGSGVQGWIHGAAHDQREYVFTYRNPKDFFDHMEFSLLPANKTVMAELKKATRHDEVLLIGKFGKNPSSQKHIIVESIKTIAAYTPPPVAARKREADLPKDLLAGKSTLATVHAVAAEGEILVLEYKDAVVPVFVKDTAVSKTLFRGDKIRIHYTVQKTPKLPVHLGLDSSVKTPIEVLDRVEDQHGKKLTLQGSLVYFPKSPQIRFGVYAIQVKDTDGLSRNYTLVNFEDPDVFSEIRKKLDKIWSEATTTPKDGRNCLIQPSIQIRAEGDGNVVSPNQANPQILLDGPDAITVVP